MALNKFIGLNLILVSILLITHSLFAIYVDQCLKSSVSFPDFFTKDIVGFFQLETSTYGKITRMVLILILPSLGAEIYMNKKKLNHSENAQSNYCSSNNSDNLLHFVLSIL